MKWFCLFVCVGMLSAHTLFAQNNQSTTPDSTQTEPSEGGELVLDEIDIQGEVEKPGVIVLPKRVDSEMGRIELGRSFDEEVKNGVEALPQTEEALGQVDHVKSIKKAVERKRN